MVECEQGRYRRSRTKTEHSSLGLMRWASEPIRGEMDIR